MVQFSIAQHTTQTVYLKVMFTDGLSFSQHNSLKCNSFYSIKCSFKKKFLLVYNWLYSSGYLGYRVALLGSYNTLSFKDIIHNEFTVQLYIFFFPGIRPGPGVWARQPMSSCTLHHCTSAISLYAHKIFSSGPCSPSPTPPQRTTLQRGQKNHQVLTADSESHLDLARSPRHTENTCPKEFNSFPYIYSRLLPSFRNLTRERKRHKSKENGLCVGWGEEWSRL